MKKTRIIISIIFIVCGLFFLWQAPSSSKKSAQASALVQISLLKKAILSETIEAYGTVQANPKTTQAFSLPIAAVIQHVYVTSGEIVKRGEPLFDYLPDLSVQLSYQQAKNNLTFAQNERKRTQQLYTQQLATQSQLATANKAVQDAQQALKSAQSQGSAPTLQVLKAPFDGIVTQAAPSIMGNYIPVAAGTILFQLGHCDAMTAELNVEPSDITQVMPHSSVTISVLDGKSSAFQGTVTQVSYFTNPQTRLMDVWASLPSVSCQQVPIGRPVKARFMVKQAKLWAVPKTAVLKDPQGYYLYRIKQNQAQKIYVVPVIYEDNQIGIEGPLQANDSIVISGNYELKDHLLVRTK